ncbi:hypothetical protein [Methanosarcina siciliae]|nr:hypothetical protein [Methanosarcina siciliae]
MSKKTDSQDDYEEDSTSKKECFVIMPISDRSPYDEEHFRIVLSI